MTVGIGRTGRWVGLCLLACAGCREPTQLVVVVDATSELWSSIDRVHAWSSLGSAAPTAPVDATTFELADHGPLPLSYAIVPGDDREGALFVHLRAEDDDRSADLCLESAFVDNTRVVVVGRFERWCSDDCPPCVPAEPCGVDGSDIAATVAACAPERRDAGIRDGGPPAQDAGQERDGGDMDRRDGGVARDGGTQDAGVRDGGTNRDSGIPPLVENGLLVRYFLDEDPQSGAARRAIDSASGEPLNLERMTSPNGPTYVEGSAGRSASWSVPGGAGAFGDLVSPKVLVGLQDGRRATIEIVVEDLFPSSVTSSLVYLGPMSGGALGLYVTQNQLILALDGSTDIRWNVVLGGPLQREVITVVLDTSQPFITDRVDLYLGGSPGPSSQLGPDRHRSIKLLAGDSVFIGNGPGANASVGGRIGYVAIYDRPLTAAEVAANAASLRVSHDTR